MPLGAAAAFEPLPACEVVSRIEKVFGFMQPSTVKQGNGPAIYYKLQGFAGYIGFISALSHGFCKTCNRLRLSASGILKPCLASSLGLDLRSLVRHGACDMEIENAILELVARKPAGHSFNDVNKKQKHVNKEMFRIGG
jgi:cyclic pyranopterin phosphate synthase